MHERIQTIHKLIIQLLSRISTRPPIYMDIESSKNHHINIQTHNQSLTPGSRHPASVFRIGRELRSTCCRFNIAKPHLSSLHIIPCSHAPNAQEGSRYRNGACPHGQGQIVKISRLGSAVYEFSVAPLLYDGCRTPSISAPVRFPQMPLMQVPQPQDRPLVCSSINFRPTKIVSCIPR